MTMATKEIIKANSVGNIAVSRMSPTSAYEVIVWRNGATELAIEARSDSGYTRIDVTTGQPAIEVVKLHDGDCLAFQVNFEFGHPLTVLIHDNVMIMCRDCHGEGVITCAEKLTPTTNRNVQWVDMSDRPAR